MSNSLGRAFQSRWLSRGMLFVALALYLALAIYQWNLPGLNYDEALDAVPAMHLALHQPLDNEGVLHVAGHDWPLMVMPYVGCTSTYLLVPGFSWLGVNMLSLRLTNVLVGLIALIAVWGCLRMLLDERAASLSTLLLAVNPSFIFWSRMAPFVALPMLPLAMVTLGSLYLWYQRRRGGPLVLAGLAVGLGLSTKVLFLWYPVALAVAWLLLSPWLEGERTWRAWLWPWRRTSVGYWALAALAGLVGSWMLVLYNLQGDRTLNMLLRNAVHTELYGVNNLDVLGNLHTVFATDFRTLLDGSWFGLSLGGPYHNPLAVPALGLAIVALVALGLRKRLSYSPRRLALLGILMFAIVFQSAFTITGLGALHLVIAWPMPQALIAAALLSLADDLALQMPWRRRRVLLTTSVVALLLIGAELATTCRYHITLARTGGVGFFSDAINDLAHDLQAPGAPPAVLLDWGFRRNLQILTQDRVPLEERYDYSQHPGEGFKQWIDARVTGPAALYIFHAPGQEAFAGHLEAFMAAAQHHRLTPVLAKTYYQRDGKPVYLVYRLEPAPHLFSAPAMQHVTPARLGESISLLGYDLDEQVLRPGGELQLTLYWQAQQQPGASYKVFVHLVGPGGQIVAQYDGQPQSWGYPTNQWQAGEVVPDRIWLSLPGQLPAGPYTLLTGMYEEASGQRLPILQNGQRPPDDRLPLQQFTVQK